METVEVHRDVPVHSERLVEVEVIVEKPIEHTKVEIHEVHHDVPVETVRVERVEVEVPIER